MQQSTVIVAATFGGFVLWLAANNRLVNYWNILTGKTRSGAVVVSSAGPGQPVPPPAAPVPPPAAGAAPTSSSSSAPAPTLINT